MSPYVGILRVVFTENFINIVNINAGKKSNFH